MNSCYYSKRDFFYGLVGALACSACTGTTPGTATATLTVKALTGIHTRSENILNLNYQINPFNPIITISFPNLNRKADIFIYDLSGREMFRRFGNCGAKSKVGCRRVFKWNLFAYSKFRPKGFSDEIDIG